MERDEKRKENEKDREMDRYWIGRDMERRDTKERGDKRKGH